MSVSAERLAGWQERFAANNPDGPQRIASITEPLPVPLTVLLVRRGGYAVAVLGPSGLLGHKVGKRHVQSRTAAGGWSQQRFARRRANQADVLVGAVADHLDRLLRESGVEPAALATGGDRTLVSEVLADPRLRRLTRLPTRDYPAIGDPRRAELDEVVRRATAYEIGIEDG